MSQPVPARLSAALLFVIAALALGLVEVGVLEYSYERIGLRPRVFGALLAASLLGSLINLPLGRLPGRSPAAGGVDERAGDRHAAPPTSTAHPAQGDTLLAVNVGGAIVPVGLSAYLIGMQGLGWASLAASALVALVTHRFATPVRGVGIAMPVFVPPLVAAGAAVLLAPSQAPALAYVAGTLGTLVGADLTNLGRVRGLGAPVVSIGGAGTFDGIFLSGIIAVLLA